MPYINGSFVPDYTAYSSDPSTSIQVGNTVGNFLPASLAGPQISGQTGYLNPTGSTASQGPLSPDTYASPSSSAYTPMTSSPGLTGTPQAAGAGGGNMLMDIGTLAAIPVGFWAANKYGRKGINALRGRLAGQFGRGGINTATGVSEAPLGIGETINFGADAAAETAAKQGLFSRFGAALPGTAAKATLATRAIGGVGPVVGAVAPGLINEYAPGNQDVKDIIGNTIAGAGIGSTGFLASPAVGIPTTAIGAGVGFVKGVGEVALDWLGGGGGEGPKASPDDLRGALNNQATKLGQNGQSYVDQFNTYRNLQMINPETKKTYTDQEIADKLGKQMIAAYENDQATSEQAALMEQQTQANAAAIMAIQSQASQYFQPYANNIMSSSLAEADYLNKMADTMPPAYQSIFRNQAQQAITQGNRLSSSYMLQASISPAAMLSQQDLAAQQKYADTQLQILQYQNAIGKQSSTQGFDNVVPSG